MIDPSIFDDVKERPNLRRYTEDEAIAICDRWLELRRQGDIAESDRVKRLVPMIPELLDGLKRDRGIEYVIDSGLNCSLAVERYGMGWLEG